MLESRQDCKQKVTDFIADSIVLDITEAVVTQCVNLRKGKKVKTPDAIIAATAVAYNYTIITNNEKDFGNIKGLKMLNPISCKSGRPNFISSWFQFYFL